MSGELKDIIGPSRFEKADYMARCWVQGTKMNKYRNAPDRFGPVHGGFHERFTEHPWVREAITEGWDRELRQYLIAAVKFRLLNGQFFTDFRIEQLMPDKVYIDAWKDQARRWREAEAWRKDMEAKHGTMESYFAKTAHLRGKATVGRAAKKVVSGLTSRSLAMTGEGA